jgi:DNA-binding MarR family transcriptional regulator
MKRPQAWMAITERADVTIDRPAATILLVLSGHEPNHCHLRELTNQLGVEAPSVSRKVQQLEQAGLIARKQDASDHRVFDLRVTKEGSLIVKRIQEAQRYIIDQVLSAWPLVERQQFIRLFEKFSYDMVGQYKLMTNPQTIKE